MPAGSASHHPGGFHAGPWSSPSTSEDESAPSLNGGHAAPLLQRSSARRILLRSTTSLGRASSSQLPSHGSSQRRHRRTLSNSQHVSGSFEQSAANLKPDLLAPLSVHSTLPPLPEGASPREGASLSSAQYQVEVVALALLHPSVAGEVGPSFTRLLGRSR